MLYVIAIVNLLIGIITFAYLFAEPKPVADYLYAAILGSIVLNILSFVLLWKGWKNIARNKEIIARHLFVRGDFEVWLPILASPQRMDLLWH